MEITHIVPITTISRWMYKGQKVYSQQEKPMIEKRHQGYVVGADPASRATLWKVRVKDTTSTYDGRKFIVASVHENIALARGLNVTFLIGTVDDENGTKVERAVDVRLQ